MSFKMTEVARETDVFFRRRTLFGQKNNVVLQQQALDSGYFVGGDRTYIDTRDLSAQSARESANRPC